MRDPLVTRLTFPLETEAAIRRRMLKICQDHARIVVDIVRELTLLIESIANNEKEAHIHFEKMKSLINESKTIKTNLLEEIVSVGSLLISRESFLRLIFEVEKIADHAEGAAVRITEMAEFKWKPDGKFMNGLSAFMDAVLDEIIKMRETMISLGFNPEKAMDLAKTVEDNEKELDSINRQLDSRILQSKMSPPMMMLARDILSHIEGLSDLAVDVIDLIRLIAIYG